MDGYLKIGEFSRLSQVTVKTLHHYDDLGLLGPAYIDPSTGYRYYELDQLPRIHRIIALKEIGLSLEQIGLLLDEELSTEQIRGMLRLKQVEIQRQVRESQQKLAMVEFRLRMIDAETNFPALDVVIKRLEKMRFLSLFVESHPTPEKAQQSMIRVAYDINKAIAAGAIKHTGVTIDVFHGKVILPFESAKRNDRQHEILIGVEETQEAITLEGIGRLTIQEEPAVETAATLMLTKDDSGLEPHEKTTLMRRWAIAHGYKPHALVRYLHHRGPLQTLNREEFVFEAQLPLEEGAN